MKLVKTDVQLNKVYRFCKLQVILYQFQDMDADLMEVKWEPGEYVSAASAQASLTKSIKNLRLPMRATLFRGHLYLTKTTPKLTSTVYMGGPSPYPCTEGEGGNGR